MEKLNPEERLFREKLNYWGILLNILHYCNRPHALPSRLKNFFLHALSRLLAHLIIFSEKAGQENLGSEIMKIGRRPLRFVQLEIEPSLFLS